MVPSIAWWRGRRSEVQGKKNRGHHRGAAAPGASVPWRPRIVVSDAPSEPQGPCLPAGPPELLLGLVREGAAVHDCNSYAYRPDDATIVFGSEAAGPRPAPRDIAIGGGTAARSANRQGS